MAFNPEVLQLVEFKSIGAFIDLIFFLDIIVAFRTTFISVHSGLEIDSPKAIAIQYSKDSFLIDFLATVPFDSAAEVVLGDAGFFKVLGALKLVRVLRIGRIITYL